ncbi:MAG: hypothetical protein JRH12_14775 [Deltaproteobacteria bacterium]|jgi:hypothetical protein|nr:hypothetical protein [Deltaproteobacteria bacterium]MBW2482907.1 hypothetical protein [Deltaproteobacteria bacterium]
MKKLFFHITVAALMAGLSLWGCSGNSGEEAEKGAIRKMTDEVAHDLAHRIKDPIDKARSVKNQEQDRLDDLEDTAEESSRVD